MKKPSQFRKSELLSLTYKHGGYDPDRQAAQKVVVGACLSGESDHYLDYILKKYAVPIGDNRNDDSNTETLYSWNQKLICEMLVWHVMKNRTEFSRDELIDSLSDYNYFSSGNRNWYDAIDRRTVFRYDTNRNVEKSEGTRIVSLNPLTKITWTPRDLLLKNYVDMTENPPEC